MIKVGGGPQIQGLVRADGVVSGAEVVEAPLLSAEVAFRGMSGLVLEGTVQAFMSAVLLRLGGLGEVGKDAETDPPDGEAGEATAGVGGEG